MKAGFFLIFLLLLIAILLASAVSFTTAPLINDGSNATTTDSLQCEWASSGDTIQTNVTWFKDGVSFLNITNATSPSIIGAGNTTKNEIWNCSVAIINATANVMQSDNINIENANPSPLQVLNETGADIGNATNILEDVARSFNVTTTDPDGDALTYSGIGLPSGSSLDSNTGIFSWTPTSSQVGQTNVTFIVLDNNTPDKGSAAKEISFNVLEVNDNPVFSPALQNQTATEDIPFSYNISATDEESDEPFNFTISSNLANLIINITGNTTATITFTGGAPSFADGGNHTINVTVNDTRNGSNTSSFNLEVLTVNQAPNLSLIPNASGTQGVLFTLVVNATDREVNDTLSFAINTLSCPVANPWTIAKINQTTIGNETFANATINQTLTNDHVACNQVNISVTDSKVNDSQIVTFNITNVNDNPILHQNSTNPSNTGINNITNQTAFANAQYAYTVNATDPDQIVAGGEVLVYSDNATFFTINSSTGAISFIPNTSSIGNHTILITVSDDEGLNNTEIMNLEIRNNSAPILINPGNVSCAEDVLCTIFITATDADNDNITFSSSNASIFNISQFNQTAGVLNTTYLQSLVGNYSITITATDIRGATDNVTIVFDVNNTNDAPVLVTIVFPSTIVATHPVSVQANATDEDIQLFGGLELLNYSSEFITNQTLFAINTSFNNQTNASLGIIEFTPNSSQVGNHSVNISVRDPQNATDWQVVNFTVLADTDPPNISQVIPHGLPVSNFTVFSLRSTSDFPGINTTVNITENVTVLFNHTTTDDTTALENLTFLWELNGTNVSSNYSYTRAFDFFSSGISNLTITVSDDRLENSTFLWILNVTNVNRAPLLLNSLDNVTISSTETFVDYLELRSNVKFIDPDDDLNSDLDLDANETNNLAFAAGTCSVADITITGSDVRFAPTQVGTCSITFTATDPGNASLVSNSVLVNVTAVPNGTTEPTPSSSSIGGGGGGGGSANSIIPRNIEVENPQPLSIIAPGEVTIYRNRSITIPIFLENNWNDTLEEIIIDSFVNVSGVNIGFDKTYFERIEPEGREKLLMTVSGYRLGDNFEVGINASVNSPEFEDSTLILFNSIEEAENEEQVRVLVTFARDLLASNKECQELGELLDKAQQESDKGNFKESGKLLDTVINGCKYLVSKTQIRKEQPKMINLDFLRKFNWFYAGIGALLLALVAGIVFIEMRIRKEKKES